MWSLPLDIFTLRKVSNAIFIFCVAAIATLPSGTLAGVPLKYFLLVVVIFYFGLCAKTFPRAFFVHFFGIAFFLISYAALGLSDFGRFAINELVLALGAILLGMFVAHIVDRRNLGEAGIISIYKLSILLFAALKIFILFVYFRSPDFTAFIEGFLVNYQEVTGSKFVSMELPYGLIRIYMQYDLVAALFPLAVSVLRPRYGVTAGDRFFVVLCLTIVLLGFSRFNMACYALSLLIFLWSDKGGLGFKVSLVVFAVAGVTVLFQQIVEFVNIRFFSYQNEVSDEIRFNQAEILIDFFKESPILGHGLGAYTDELIRSPAVPFSYEQQVLSLLPKFGLIGFSVVLCYVTYLIWYMLQKRYFCVALFLSLYLFASLFNPYLFSSNMVVVYALIFYVYLYLPPLEVRLSRTEKSRENSVPSKPESSA
ncbi:O-antigen ligase family protein [Halomonas sp.]|uniref:O-antigen ligase family protein n=1 Tax=Halomonas sp. TaxID=1486246 RepID=UPI00384A9BC2